MARYLGLDSSTQSLSAVVVDTDTGKVVLDQSLSFGAALPQYASPNGFLEHADERVKQSNPLMWVDALDRLLSYVVSRLKSQGLLVFDFWYGPSVLSLRPVSRWKEFEANGAKILRLTAAELDWNN